MEELLLKKSRINGLGVFANREFKKGERILEYKGEILTFIEVPTHFDRNVEDRYVQISKRLYMGESGGMDDFINHSCNPNSGLKISGRKAFLFAIKRIKKGEEINWDYSTTMDEDNWEIECHCKAKSCRKVIRDFKYLPSATKKRYAKLGIVPAYNLKYLN